MSYEAKMNSVMRVLSEGRAVRFHVYVDKRKKMEQALNECYAYFLMIEWDIREIAYRFGRYELSNGAHYLTALLYPATERHPQIHALFFFPEDH